ncbi:cyclin-dependent kinase inhibitor 1D [Xyrauchen texanus]|uniref:cyclin-dependent kinase inhibitor 1D n=1 Tax=Xyrauchen texanus TaxID=154827 RepID=UPI00224262CA|nr:cyclin-dependent kinase inhibitor 1D [Xyrauchen texanus]
MTMSPVECDIGLLKGRDEDIKPHAVKLRRNLFGPVDHEQLQQDFKNLFCMSLEIAKQRWNFDFQRDKPAPGSAEWEELWCQDVPVFYHSCVVKPAMARQRVDTTTGGGAFACSTLSMATQKYRELQSRGPLRGVKPEKRMTVLLGVKRKQANITDFFRVTKRRFLHHKTSS